MIAIFGTVLVFLFTLMFVYNWQCHHYWSSRGVFSPAACPFLGHSHYFIIKNYIWEMHDEIYRKAKSRGLWGMYDGLTPRCCIADPALIREVMIKHADHFVDRRHMPLSGDEKIFLEMLTMVKGEKWKSLRSLLSPTFTSGKIKTMFPAISQKVRQFLEECQGDVQTQSFVEMSSLFSYYTMDIIATCAFGIDANCLQQREKSLFISHGRSFSTLSFDKMLVFILLVLSPKLFKALNLQISSSKTIQFYSDVIYKTIQLRKESGTRKGDFLDLILDALEECERSGQNSKYPMTMNTVVAQSILFLLAGFDPTSNTMSFMAYLLAKNPRAQETLRKELTTIVDEDGDFSYRSLVEAPYLDACLSETLRLFSPAHTAERLCTKAFRIPGTDLEIPQDMLITIPIWSLHRDPDLWAEPLSFHPERFLPERSQEVTPYAYLPFGLGPRNCIGQRFAQLEAKIVIARLCLEYELELRPGFTEMVLDKNPSTLRPNKNGVQLVLRKLHRQT